MRAIFRPLFVLIALITPLAAQALECDIAVFAPLADSSPYRVSLSSAEIVDEAGGYCRLEGEIGNTDGQSQIRFRLRFPDAAGWNGRFLVSGNGGTAGAFQSENRVQVALELGYATGQTDTGHVRDGAEDWLMTETESGVLIPNYAAIEDFGHRSIHLTSVVGKQFVDAFYARAPEYSYYLGCSTGGRQGLKAMQRYPNDFDGIVAGAPVFSLTRLNMSQVWAAQRAAELDDSGEALVGEQLDLIKESVVAMCDSLDGVTDRLIDDPRQCSFDPAVLQCSAGDSPPQCLSEPQVEFVRTIYDGPVTSAGEQIYPGRVHGSEGGGMGGMGGWTDLLPAACPNEAGTSRCDLVSRAWHQDPGRDMGKDFSIDNPDDVAAADSSYYSGVTRADNPDVTPFVQGGGKAIIYHGWSDPGVTPLTTIEFYEAMEDTVSRKRQESDFRDHLRLFLAPGMGHCQGGDGANDYLGPALEAIDSWVSEGRAPDSIIATNAQRGLSRPWCPYPQVARLREPGLDSTDAESFECVSP
ncbi:MAG: tannase/feruloyl esterase family alpha/beta hydrolase [Candidatus Rariloculaceae bacterium]